MQKPMVHPAVLLSPAADGYVAYDTASDQLHQLNQSAALIIELCDGSRAVDEICKIASTVLPGAEGNVSPWIEQAGGVGLLIEAESETSCGQPVRSLSADQLAELAGRLQDHGKIQTAYICQQQAVELRPGDAKHLRNLGELAHILGRRDEAREAYECYSLLEPDDAEILHLLVSLRNETPPARVPNECLEQLYQRFSTFYETNMCDDLGYEGPTHLRAVVDPVIGDRRELSVLDLGCGTGLCGVELKDLASRIVGVDISCGMVEQARQRMIYDDLHVAEITAWLEQACQQHADQRYDLIVACDALIYFGDLRQVIVPAARLLKPGGTIAFSVEQSAEPPFQLTDNGRYVHHSDHIHQVAHASGLQVRVHNRAFLRMEYGKEVIALYVAMAV